MFLKKIRKWKIMKFTMNTLANLIIILNKEMVHKAGKMETNILVNGKMIK